MEIFHAQNANAQSKKKKINVQNLNEYQILFWMNKDIIYPNGDFSLNTL